MSIIPLAFHRNRRATRRPAWFADIPGYEAGQIADFVQIPPPNGITPGKHVDDLAPVLDLVRPTPKVCRCGKPATIQVQSFVRGAKPVDLCDECPERFAVIDGGDCA